MQSVLLSRALYYKRLLGRCLWHFQCTTHNTKECHF